MREPFKFKEVKKAHYLSKRHWLKAKFRQIHSYFGKKILNRLVRLYPEEAQNTLSDVYFKKMQEIDYEIENINVIHLDEIEEHYSESSTVKVHKKLYRKDLNPYKVKKLGESSEEEQIQK